MRIGYDASSTLGPRTGIGRVSLGLLSALAARMEDEPGLELAVWLNSLRHGPGAEHGFLSNTPRMTAKRSRRPGPLVVRAWKSGRGPAAEDLLEGVDLWHGPASYMPPAKRAKRVVSVYDLAFLEESPAQRSSLGGGYFADLFPKLLPAMDAIVVPGEWTRSQVLEHYDVQADRVSIVTPGIDPATFYPEAERFVEIAGHMCGITEKSYLLAVGDHSPRKRCGLLLDAYARLRAKHPETPKLLILGWGGQPAPELRERPDLHRHIILAPRLADKYLAGIYSGAVATVITSRHEGFGLPVLEAMACGSPVVCAPVTSLPEAGGDAAVYVEDGSSPDAWAEAIAGVIFDTDVRNRIREAGIARAARFTWARAAEELLGVYRSVWPW